MRRPLTAARALAPRGQVSWVTLLLLVLVVGGGYLGWAWSPAYIYNFQAKQVVRDFMNRAVKDRNDDRLVDEMCKKLRALGTVQRVAEDGSVEEVPAVDVAPEDVTWEPDRDVSPPMLRVTFSYTAEVTYPFLDRTAEKVFDIDFVKDIQAPNWN